MATDQVRFTLKDITVEQFATLFEPTNENNVKVGISLTIKSNYAHRAVALSLIARFVEEDRPFLQIEDTCHFLIHEEDWTRLSNGDTADVKLPKRLLINLFTIAVGATRGLLYGKTEHTPYNRFILPLLDATEMITGPVTIKKQLEN